MIFSMDVRRAHKGDCLLLHFGSKKDPGLVMIDGGPGDVYTPQLKPRLLEIRKKRGMDSNEPLPVDLLMVSHVDDDHIRGILDLTRDMAEQVKAPIIRVFSFWHNSFDDIIGGKPEELTAAAVAQFGAASLGGELSEDAIVDCGQDEETVVDTLKVLAGVAQGHRLRGDAEMLEFPLNPEFNGKLILASDEEVEVAEGLTFTVAGPMQHELEALHKDHQKWLKEQEKKKAAGAALAAYVDPSVPNLSSIVVLARYAGKSMLLTGDARGDKILEGLELSGLLQKDGTMHVDILKVPHHGSSNNMEKGFFERVTAGHYVFSGDGQHGNPERETIEMLFDARGDQPFEVHLTYPVSTIDEAREKDWKKEQGKEKKRAAAGHKQKLRPDWSHEEQSLETFFDGKKLAEGQVIHIVDCKEPHVIDLLDPLGY